MFFFVCFLTNFGYNKVGGSMQRYFAKDKIGNQFVLENEDLYHIKTVMRMKDKDQIYVVFNQITYICCLENVKQNIQIMMIEEQKNWKQKFPEVVIFVPLLKEQKMDLILQKATELGVSKIVPIVTSRSIIRVNEERIDKKIERWKRICKEASEQAHRNTIPEIAPVMNIMHMKNSDGLALVCSTTEKEKNMKYVLQKYRDCDKISVVMGPEGGLSKEEEEYLKEVGYIPITLGHNIMRVETVPIFVLSTINYEFME